MPQAVAKTARNGRKRHDGPCLAEGATALLWPWPCSVPHRASSRFSGRPIPARRISPSSACSAIRRGMIGFPLRLLARENYDRIVKLRGARAVALITGEEKILPPNPSYFVCTVESMPLDRPVEFLAVDEIQLCADPERGHVFTARLLHARGTHRDDVSRRRHDPAADAPAGARSRVCQPAALFDPGLYRAQEGDAAAARAAPSSPSAWPTSSRWPNWCGASAAAPRSCSAR